MTIRNRPSNTLWATRRPFSAGSAPESSLYRKLGRYMNSPTASTTANTTARGMITAETILLLFSFFSSSSSRPASCAERIRQR